MSKPVIKKTGTELIAEERQRQIDVEGWSAEHDKQHTEGELAIAAALYASPVKLYARISNQTEIKFVDPWPWWDTVEVTRYGDGLTTTVPAWDKRAKHSRLRRLVIAGALIAAEIDRLSREVSNDQ